MGIDATDRQGQAICEFALDTQGSLLGVRILIIGLAAENYTERGNRTGVRNRDVQRWLGQVSRRDASGIARCRRCTLNLALCKQRLENFRRRKGCVPGGSGKGHKHLGNLSETIDIAQSLNYVGNLAIDLRIEDPEPAAHYSLVIFEGIPGEGNAGSKIVLVRVQGTILGIQFVA